MRFTLATSGSSLFKEEEREQKRDQILVPRSDEDV